MAYKNKVLNKFDRNCLLYKYFVSWNKEATITITDADFPSLNPNNILTIATRLKDRQSNESSIGAFNTSLSFLKDYVTEFCRTNVEFSHLFGTENLLAKICIEHPEAQILAECHIEEPEVGFVYLKKKINRKEFF